MASMSDDEMGEAMEGLFAYDSGCVDSGIHDELLRGKVEDWLRTMSSEWLSRWVRERYLSEGALAQGYRLEDVRAFIEWLVDRMAFDV